MHDPSELYSRLLVIRCQAGDAAALEELIATHQPRLRAFLHKMRRGQSDDLAQDVWLDVFRDVRQLADPGAFVPWLYRIARNHVYRAIYRRRPWPSQIEGDDVAVDEPDEAFGPEDAAAVHAALDELSPEQREVLLLRFMEDLSYEQIAAAVGCNVGTVRSRIHNAKRRLKETIEQGNKS
jgi:RNA polymerase sigma-70 factor (ECF subfamily)